MLHPNVAVSERKTGVIILNSYTLCWNQVFWLGSINLEVGIANYKHRKCNHWHI